VKRKIAGQFLEQILTQLRGAGYIETKRGKAGATFSPKRPAKSASAT